MNGRNFSDILREEADHVWERILTHPFITEMGEGRLPLDKFRFYVKQDHAFLIDYARCLGVAASRAEDMETMRALASLLNGCFSVELVALERLSERLGIPMSELSSEPAPTNLAYANHLLSVAHSGAIGETVAAMLPCMWTYQEIGEKIGERDSLKRQPIYYDWCKVYRSQNYIDLVDWYRDLTDRSSSRSSATVRDRMRRHFILSSRYEYMFWDMAYREEGWPV